MPRGNLKKLSTKMQFDGKEEAANVDNFRKFQEDFWKKDFVNKGRQKLNLPFKTDVDIKNLTNYGKVYKIKTVGNDWNFVFKKYVSDK